MVYPKTASLGEALLEGSRGPQTLGSSGIVA